jgi:hypothetical protein
MAGFTPGPWVYDDDTATVDTALGVAVAGINDEDGSDTCWANGHIVAAAPELLAALHIARHYVAIAPASGIDNVYADLAIVDRAIAKAEGRS